MDVLLKFFDLLLQILNLLFLGDNVFDEFVILFQKGRVFGLKRHQLDVQ
jgi:hypothetical protein